MPMKSLIQVSSLLLVLLLVVTAASVTQADQWPRFRGPNGEGKSDLQGVPTNWSMNDYEWVLDLQGIGHSSPAIWNEFLFVTQGETDPQTGAVNGSRSLICLDALTGERKWSDTIELSANHLHKKNSYGSGTPATDGERVYVVFADEQHYLVNAYTMGGELVWSEDIGTFTSQHGQGVSPMLYNGLVIVPNDQMGPSSILALNAETGKTEWKTERVHRKTSYSTPMVLNVNGQDQLICLSGATGLSGIDPQNGRMIWKSGELPLRTVASPMYGNGLLMASCGQGGRGKFMVFVDPTGRGEVGTTHVKAERIQNLPYVPTPIIDGNYAYLWNDDGVVCCIDLSGDVTQNVWRERIGGNFSGSPVMINGKLYCISEEGEIAVVDASPNFHEYGKNPLGDVSYATPAVANGRVYFKGFGTLACLKANASP